MSDIIGTLDTIMKDGKLRKGFVENPESTLKELGVETDDLRIKKSIDTASAQRSRRQPGKSPAGRGRPGPIIPKQIDWDNLDLDKVLPDFAKIPAESLTVCGGIGAGICASVGGEL